MFLATLEALDFLENYSADFFALKAPFYPMLFPQSFKTNTSLHFQCNFSTLLQFSSDDIVENHFQTTGKGVELVARALSSLLFSR